MNKNMIQFSRILLKVPKRILRIAIDLAYPYIHKRILHLHRIQIAKDLFNKYGGSIAYGPFKGLEIVKSSKSISPDFPSMYFGIYEQEILNSIQNHPDKYRNFVNFGAGDGYYALGAVLNGLFDTSIAFEEAPHRQEKIFELARANDLLERIEIFGRADYFSIQNMPSDLLAKSVFLVDIEGGEFEIFNPETINLLKNSIVIIEVHDFLVKDGHQRLAQLKHDVLRHFNITNFTTSARDLSQFAELNEYSDLDRWFNCIEGRGKQMTWWRLDPKNSTAKVN
jgi:hypothetical protein